MITQISDRSLRKTFKLTILPITIIVLAVPINLLS